MSIPLANLKSKFDLIRWNVPFANERWPSVGFITDPDSSKAVLVVRPGGFCKYPQYLVRFSDVVTLLCYEETCAIERDWDFLSRSEYDLCAYRWLSSPWLKHYRKVLEKTMFTKCEEKMHHYILIGADSIVEVIAHGEAVIERVETKMVIEMKYEV